MNSGEVMTIMTNMNRAAYPTPAPTGEWSVAEAKARFSELVAKAKAGVPQRVTRYGKDEVVVVSVEDWQARCQGDHVAPGPGPSLFDVFEPLIGSGLVLERMPGGLREPPFGHDD